MVGDMSDFLNDTRAQQIDREEVWFGATLVNVPSGSAGTYMTIETDANEVQFNLESISRGALEVSLWEGPTVSSPGGLQANRNMRLSSSNTTSVEIRTVATVSDPGTNDLLFVIPERQKLDINPFKEGNGVILKASTLYTILFVNLSLRKTRAYLNWFFREI